MDKSKSKKSLFSRINAWLRLWLGIISGIILVFVALTGTLIVYCDEIMDLSAGKAKYVEANGRQRLPLEVLTANIKKTFPSRKNPSEFTYFKDPSRSVRYRTFDKKKGLSMVYVDPYSGKILKDDGTANFFYIMAHLHASMLWHGPGTWIVDIATIIFLIELTSGIILWWPKKWTKHSRDASFKIKWKAKFKRVNYDLHNVLGFYSSLLALILTITGIIIAFEPVAKVTAEALGADVSTKWQKKLPGLDTTKRAFPFIQIADRIFKANPEKNVIQLYTYRLDSSGYYLLTAAKKIGLKSAENPTISVLDKYTGTPLNVNKKSLKGEYVENVVWQLHMGLWLGQGGKLFTFLTGLVCTSLPITGFLIWWGKGKKKKSKRTIPAT